MKTYAVYYIKNGYKEMILLHGCDGEMDAVNKFYTMFDLSYFVYDVRKQ